MTTKQSLFLDFATKYLFSGIKIEKRVEVKSFLGTVYSKKEVTDKKIIKYNNFNFKPTDGGNFEWSVSDDIVQVEGEGRNVVELLEVLVIEFNLISRETLAKVVNKYIVLS